MIDPPALVRGCNTLATSQTPALRLGDGEGLLFDRIAGGAILGTDSVVILDSGYRNLFLITESGGSRTVLADRGQGPGEISGAPRLLSTSASEVQFYEIGGRLHKVPISAGNASAETTQVAPMLGVSGLVAGRVVVQEPFAVGEGPIRADSFDVRLFDDLRSSDARTVGRFPSGERYYSTDGGVFSTFPVPFARTTSVLVWPSRGVLGVSDNMTGVVQLFDSTGELIGTVDLGRAIPPLELTNQLIASWERRFPERANTMREVDTWTPPEYGPRVDGMVADRAGLVWARIAITDFDDQTHRFLGFDEHGAVVDSLQVRDHQRVRILDSDSTRVLLLVEDSLGVDRLQIHNRVCGG